MDYDVSNLAAVNFNTTFAGIETADAILIVGSQIRWEAPLVNVRLRKAVKRGAKVFIVGPQWDPTYPANFLGEDTERAWAICPGHVADAFKAAERPAIILGGAALARVRWRRRSRLPNKFEPGEGWLERLQRAALLRRAHGRADARLCAEGRHRGYRQGASRKCCWRWARTKWISSRSPTA